ncbi:MAG: DUF928 domain-containing protein [Limnospira sp.]
MKLPGIFTAIISTVFSWRAIAGISPLPATAEFRTPDVESDPDRREAQLFHDREISLKALVPARGGVTIAPYPTFWFYIPPAADVRATLEGYFVLEDAANRRIYETRLILPKTETLLAINITAETLPPLEIGQSYRWFFTVWNVDPACGNTVSGTVERVASDPSLRAALETATYRERPQLYADHGIWYDSISTLAELRRTDPTDTTLATQWYNLLRSVGLEEFAEVPFTNRLSSSEYRPPDTDINPFLHPGYESSPCE